MTGYPTQKGVRIIERMLRVDKVTEEVAVQKVRRLTRPPWSMPELTVRCFEAMEVADVLKLPWTSDRSRALVAACADAMESDGVELERQLDEGVDPPKGL